MEFAKYVIFFKNYPMPSFPAASALEWFRTRWQVEFVFERFKCLAQLEHMPNWDDGSAKAWLCGDLFAALPVEKLIRHASSVSPWRYPLEAAPSTQYLA